MGPGNEDPQVKNARNRFKNVLKHLVQETFMQEEESDSEDESRLYNNKMGKSGPGLGMPPNKRLKGGPEPVKALPAFVMKLFDRGVDLAQFNENTPLYPICRAWIQNKPHLSRQRRADDGDSDSSEMEYREDSDEVYHLPPPEPLPYDEYGDLISYRIPPLLPRIDEPFDIDYDDESAPSPALLFQNHLDRWNQIRGRWREACGYNEIRYHQSFGIMRSIYDRYRARPEAENVVRAAALEAATVKIQAEEVQEQQEMEEQQQVEQDQERMQYLE